MKKAINFIFITSIMIFLSGLHFEYLVDRDVDLWITAGSSMVLAVLFICYTVYAVKLLIKVLKLK